MEQKMFLIKEGQNFQEGGGDSDFTIQKRATTHEQCGGQGGGLPKG